MLNEHKQAALLELLMSGITIYELNTLINELEDRREEICERTGHQFESDMCGKPEHDYCILCDLPKQRYLARQGKVDEPTVSNIVLPSESLGSRSILKRVRVWLGR